MFSTILDKATGYFDKRALVSAFSPSLVFWGLVVVVVVGFQANWQTAIHVWDAFSGTVQFLLLLAFFVWVTFWSFLTINFRMMYTRLLEGYWPEHKLLAALRQRRCAYWQGRWMKLSGEDGKLAEQEAALRKEQFSYKQLQDSLASAPTSQGTPSDAEQTGKDLDDFLREAEQQVFTGGAREDAQASFPLPLQALQTLGQQTRAWWTRFIPWLAEAQQDSHSPWSKRLGRLEKITEVLSKRVDDEVEEVQTKRLALYRELSLYYPPSPADIMPTRLGNVLKASEFYSWKRYRLDAVVIWSRLQSGIPDAFSALLQDTKTSFDLMTTLCTFLLLFGVPIAIWVAIKSPGFVPWWAALILAIAALVFRLYLPAALAGLALFVALLIPHPALWIVQLQTLVVLLITFVLLFWLGYQNAVQAALDYGEKIKAAFDLYRWEVLKDLHLQLPKDFEEERKTWAEVGGLLLRGYVPDSRYYRYAEEKPQEKETNYD